MNRTKTTPHHRATPPEKVAAVRRDLQSGLYYNYDICRRHRVSSRVVTALRKAMKEGQ